jgi:NAD(P)-dependent dehydrogenase (short-subunit alcohol dehydrogenase family)
VGPGVPYDEVARLRRQAPVAWFPDEGSGFWSVTRLLTAGGDQVAIFGRRPGMGGYAVTKAELTMLTQSLAVDHAHQGLRANVVCPGWTITEMADEEMTAFGAARGGLGIGDAYSLVTSLVPVRRAAQAEEVAAVVGWLRVEVRGYEGS